MAVQFEEEQTDFAQVGTGKPTLTDKVAKALGIPSGTATSLLVLVAALCFMASYFLFQRGHVFTPGPDKAYIDHLQNSMRVVH